MSFHISQRKYPPGKAVEELFFMLHLERQQSNGNKLMMSLRVPSGL